MVRPSNFSSPGPLISRNLIVEPSRSRTQEDIFLIGHRDVVDELPSDLLYLKNIVQRNFAAAAASAGAVVVLLKLMVPHSQAGFGITDRL
jgi:hypothetical protein